MDLRSVAKSKTFLLALWIIGALVIVFAVFEAGEFVGYRKAEFSYQWGEAYYRGFGGRMGGPPMMSGAGDGDFMMGHGLFGMVLRASSSSLVMQDRDETEKVILLAPDTVIRRFRETIAPTDLEPNDRIVVIGAPNASGQIEAKLIRVMPSSTAPEPAEPPTGR